MKKYVLPGLAYGYSALEPHYAARPLELHHSKHHAAYVAGANTTLETLARPASGGTSKRSINSRRISRFTCRATCCTHSSGATWARTVEGSPAAR